VDHAFIARIHALVDLIDDPEGRLGKRLESHEIKDGRDGTLAAGLPMGRQLLEGLVFTKHDVLSAQQTKAVFT
jgi:hypothetical protein